jgi:hypothetical protein
MRTRLLLISLLIGLSVEAQTPFTTLARELIKGKKEANTQSFVQTEVENDENTEETEKVPLSFFNNNSLSMNLINTGNRVSLSSEVLHYKLYFINPDSIKIKDRKYRFNIPLLLISKLSTQYDSINSATSWDVLDYEAAPVTLRIMPSLRHKFKGYNDVIYYGFYADVRGLNMYNGTTEKYDIEFIGAGGIGFTYEGDGEAGKFNENGEYKPGKYSLSFMLQGATGKKELLQRLFDTDNEFVTSLQTYFLFRVDKDSKFNLKIGYQYLFQETLAGSKSNFSIALGI